MNQNQNETRRKSGERKAESGLRNPKSRDLTANSRDLTDRRRNPAPQLKPQSAFTLTELLVVITIIAVLAGLITGAAVNALNKAKQATITLEIQQLDAAFEDFKNEYGAYPPNGMNPGPGVNNFLGNLVSPIVQSDFERMFKKAFPRHQEHGDLIQALAGIPPGGTTPMTSSELLGGMTAAEAMVFWLGGFSKDPQFPLSGPGGPSFAENPNDSDTLLTGSDDILEDRNRRYEFDLGRLEPRDANGAFHDTANGGAGRFITYMIGGAERRVNFWQYAPSGSEQPLVYFDVSRHKPEKYDMHAVGIVSAGTPMIHAIEKLREGFSGIITASDLVFVNQGKFQILHAGLDDAWGTFMPMSLTMSGGSPENVITFPTGPFIGDIADTVGNFGTGTLEDAQE